MNLSPFLTCFKGAEKWRWGFLWELNAIINKVLFVLYNFKLYIYSIVIKTITTGTMKVLKDSQGKNMICLMGNCKCEVTTKIRKRFGSWDYVWACDQHNMCTENGKSPEAYLPALGKTASWFSVDIPSDLEKANLELLSLCKS